MRWLALVLLLSVPGTAFAAPQFGAGLTTGAAFSDLRARNTSFAYHLGARADVLLLRDRPNTMAVGPYVDVATHAFDTFEAGGGFEWLVPASDTAFVLSAGGLARTSRFGWEPAVAGTIFWGSRSFNYHAPYSIGLGIFVQGRYGFGVGKQTDAIVGVQIDLEYLALPWLFLYEAVRR